MKLEKITPAGSGARRARGGKGMLAGACAGSCSVAALVIGGAFGIARAAPPGFDHVVIVIEENHAQTQIIGNLAEAPYINSLASGGVSFDAIYGITHPSQPNYLQFFPGALRG